jgi:hypothetical protein
MPVNDWLKIGPNPKFYEVFKGFLLISQAYEKFKIVFQNHSRDNDLGKLGKATFQKGNA